MIKRTLMGAWLGLAGAALSSTAGGGAVKVVISVDWEGRDVSLNQIEKMEWFRRTYPDIPILQFLNAAYFTKPGVNATAVARLMKRAIREHDVLGLHIHGWKSLFEAAGVAFREQPRFGWLGDCETDCGHTVAISAYQAEELVRVIDLSRDILWRHGFGWATAFRAGGWLASKEVLTALVRTGFEMDSSAVPPHFLGIFPSLQEFVVDLWPEVTVTSQPYRMAAAGGSLLEVPDNGCLADYVTGADMLEVFKENVALWRQAPDRDVYVSIGFHQETAVDYLDRVADAVDLIRAYSEENRVPVAFVATVR